jgi:hypothetical protein
MRPPLTRGGWWAGLWACRGSGWLGCLGEVLQEKNFFSCGGIASTCRLERFNVESSIRGPWNHRISHSVTARYDAPSRHDASRLYAWLRDTTHHVIVDGSLDCEVRSLRCLRMRVVARAGDASLDLKAEPRVGLAADKRLGLENGPRPAARASPRPRELLSAPRVRFWRLATTRRAGG